MWKPTPTGNPASDAALGEGYALALLGIWSTGDVLRTVVLRISKHVDYERDLNVLIGMFGLLSRVLQPIGPCIQRWRPPA